MLAQLVQVPESSVFRSHFIATIPVSPGRTNGKSHWGGLGRLVNQELDKPYHIEVVVESDPDLEEVLWTLYEESGQFVDTTNCALAIYDEHTGSWDVPLMFRQGERVDPCSVNVSNDQGFIRLVFESPNPILVRDLFKTGFVIKTGPIRHDRPIRSWLSVPIRSHTSTDESVRGIIVAWSDRPNAFTNCQLQKLSELGSRAATAIHNARLLLMENVRLQKSVLAERERLARDLHDGPTQLVSGIAMCLDYCRRALERDPAQLPEQISYMQELAERAMHQMRTLLFELRPLVLETEGLGAALQALLDRRQKEVKTTRLTLGVETCQPSGESFRQKALVESAIFAIVQEAVNNALKYAQADHIEVHLKETPTAIHVAIVDDGKGFDVDAVMHGYGQRGSLGMVNMQERAELIGGKLDVRSVPGQGTHIALVAPKISSLGR
jgi:signal transduction histidine kinase